MRFKRVAEGEIKRLIILMPPRSLKSICASVALPAWLLGSDPTRRIICVSYSADLAAKHARDCRAVMTAPWYQRVFPSTRLDPAKSAETEFMTTQRGFRLATSTGGTLTGRGGNIMIIDDPMKPADAHSDARRLDLQQWYSNTLLSRLDDKNTGAIVLVMQRLHIDDLAGYLMEQGGWEVLSLPAIADGGGGGADRARQGPLPLGRGSPASRTRAARGARAAQIRDGHLRLQRPILAGPRAARRQHDQVGVVRVLLGSATATRGLHHCAELGYGLHDERACKLLGRHHGSDRKNGTIHVLDIVRGRWEFTELLRGMRKAAQCHRPKTILIEDQASGIALQQTLKCDGYTVRPIKPKGDKVMRMRVHTPTLEAGKVLLKKGAPWLDELRAEVLAFPHGKHDDQVDALSQLMTWAEDWRIPKYSIRPWRR